MRKSGEQQQLAYLARIHALEAELAEATREHELKEAELKYEFDRLRSAKRELEGRMGGVDVAAMEQEQERVKAVEARAEAAAQRHAAEMREMQRKLTWFGRPATARAACEWCSYLNSLTLRAAWVPHGRRAGPSGGMGCMYPSRSRGGGL